MKIFKLFADSFFLCLAIALPFLLVGVVGCKKPESNFTIKKEPQPSIRKKAESTQYIVEVDKNGQVLSSKEVTEDTKPTAPRIEAISREDAAKKAEEYALRKIAEMTALRNIAEAKAKEQSTKNITITIRVTWPPGNR